MHNETQCNNLKGPLFELYFSLQKASTPPKYSSKYKGFKCKTFKFVHWKLGNISFLQWKFTASRLTNTTIIYLHNLHLHFFVLA